MSSESLPITPEAFAEALAALPLGSLYTKGLEIQNSIMHLERSNVELRIFLEGIPEGDRDCEDAIVENEGVIARMNHRIELVKAELEGRGDHWFDLGSTREENGEGREGEGISTNAQNEQQQVDQGSSSERNDSRNGVSTASPAAAAGVNHAQPRHEPGTNGTDDGVYL